MKLSITTLFASLFLSQTTGVAEIEYNQHIRPILSDRCFNCHGLDEKTRKAKLRLDIREEAIKVRKGKASIVPGDPERSDLIARIISKDDDDIMPPPDSHKAALTKSEVDLLKQWIKEGAVYQGHWAFIEAKKKKESEQQDNAIDWFIEEKLKKQNLKLSSEAEKHTLMRRVSFDLTGLPPTPEELDRHLKDKSDNAYEKLVDQLLSSKRYGEHMGRYWLDAARYGDTHGLHLDNFRMMHPYRDWVINAYNKNLSFKQFTIEQLAGDLLPDSNIDQKVASGFNRCNVTTSEGGSIDEEFYVRYAVDRVNTTGTVWLGLTVGCSQCHDHKYDPISQKEYYEMYAYFNNITERAMDGNKKEVPPVIRVMSSSQKQDVKALDKQKVQLSRQYQNNKNTLEDDLFKWAEKNKPQKDKAVVSLKPWHYIGPFSKGNKRKVFDHDFGPEKNIQLNQKIGKQKWSEQKNYKDGKVHSLSNKQRSANYLYREITSDNNTQLEVSLGSDDAIKVWFNGEQLLSKFVGRGAKPDQEKLTLNLKKGSNKLLLKIVNFSGGSGFYFNSSSSHFPEHISQILRIGYENCNPQQKKQIKTYYEETLWPVNLEYKKDLASIDRKISQIERSAPSTLIMQERKTPRGAYILERGEYDKRQNKVEPNTPAFLPKQAADSQKNRLGFAKWLTRDDHPLVSRVIVNRYWQQIFGQGIVATSDDFGTQGALPSHPGLLDWLAVDFVQHGWDVKRLIKQMVMSKTYRQSSKVSPALLKVDPNNTLLTRGPRFRLDAEMIRDQALSVSKLLVQKIGGASVKPYQPDGVWFAVGYTKSNTAKYRRDRGEALYRRSVYTFWKRTAPPPAMSLFNAPSRENCTVQRERTNTPLQALNLMNDVQYIEAARQLAQRLIDEGGLSDLSKINYAYKLLLSRKASDKEYDILKKTLEHYLDDFKHNQNDAKELLNHGDSKIKKGADITLLAAWTMVSNVLLNLDEAINKG